MELPRDSGWRIAVEGDVNPSIDIDFPPEFTHEQHVATGLSITAFHCMNAVSLVCEADEPGSRPSST